MKSNPLGGSAFRQIRRVQKTHHNRNSHSGTVHWTAFSSQNQGDHPHPTPAPKEGEIGVTQACSGARTERAPASAAILARDAWPPRERRVRPAVPLCTGAAARASPAGAHVSPRPQFTTRESVDYVVEENSGSLWSSDDCRSWGGMRTHLFSPPSRRPTGSKDAEKTAFHRRTT